MAPARWRIPASLSPPKWAGFRKCCASAFCPLERKLTEKMRDFSIIPKETLSFRIAAATSGGSKETCVSQVAVKALSFSPSRTPIT